jgi:AcrR family transcriptional regulator
MRYSRGIQRTESAKKLQSEQTVARLLEAATRLFVTNGYHGTSIADIAEATNLTKGALYSHFVSKSDLLFALIKKWEAQFLDRMIQVVNAANGDAMAKLDRMLSFSAAFAGENRELCLLLTLISAELYGSENEFAKELARLYARFAQFLRGIVEEGKAQGLFDPDLDAFTLANVIIAVHDGILLQWHRSRDLLDGKDYVRMGRRVALHGIRPSRLPGDTHGR